MDTLTLFNKSIAKNNSLLCIGLDPDRSDFHKNFASIFEFNKQIIDSTLDLVCTYKPNIAFYEAEGFDGLKDLKKTIDYIHKNTKIPVILDAKRGDIPNTSRYYAKAVFDWLGADAVTYYPHLGLDAVEPFLKYKDKLTILLIKTSNPDSDTFQNLKVGREPYYLKMSKIISTWKQKNFGFMVGATYPEEMQNVRGVFPDRFFLSPGIGTQGAKIKNIIQAGLDKNKKGITFNVSRSIIHSENPRATAQQFRDEINKYR